MAARLIKHIKEFCLAHMSEVRKDLAKQGYRLHPRKFQCQHFTKGGSFLGNYFLNFIKMNTREQIQRLEERQLELLSIMSDSDAHAFKCVKLGLNFAEQYPDDYTKYVNARTEYNNNEQELETLYATLEEEEKAPEYLEEE